MTDTIRTIIKDVMYREDITPGQLANRVGTSASELARTLSTTRTNRNGKIPPLLNRILEELELELIPISTKKNPPTPGRVPRREDHAK